MRALTRDAAQELDALVDRLSLTAPEVAGTVAAVTVRLGMVRDTFNAMPPEVAKELLTDP